MTTALPDAQSSGLPSYRGYEFQIEVSVLLALRLFEKQACAHVDIEPASGEDVEAVLEVSTEQAVSEFHAAAQGLQVQVQVKQRRSPWTVGDFCELMLGSGSAPAGRGPAPRQRALAALLDNPHLRFYLITDADVSSELKAFVVDRVGDASHAGTLPATLRKEVGNRGDVAQIASRIGILERRSPALQRYETEEALKRFAHVPSTKVAECVQSLKASVRARLLGQSPTAWPAEELLRTCRGHGGMPAPTRQLSAFVAPSHFIELRQRLDAGHALLLVGPPGVGKTLVADKLAYEHQVTADPFEVIRPERPSQVRDKLHTPGRFLFYIIDPWGMYTIKNEADLWTNELPKLLADAGPDRRFLITSRTGIMREAIGDTAIHLLSRVEAAVLPEHYDANARWEILCNHLGNTRDWRRHFAAVNHSRIIGGLTVPLSLQIFADQLRRTPTEMNATLQQLLDQSAIEAISATVAKELESWLEAIPEAITLWALMMARQTVTEQMVAGIRRLMHAKDAGSRLRMTELVSRLRQAGWMQDADGEAYAAHPQVLAGFELLIKKHPTTAEDTLQTLLESLVDNGQLDMAHRIITLLPGRGLTVPPRVQHADNDYLLTVLAAANAEKYAEAFREAGQWSTGSDPVSTLIRGLHVPPQRRPLFWETPDWAPDTVAAVRSSSAARSVAERFLKWVLPDAKGSYRGLFTFLDSLGWDFSDALQELIPGALEGGFSNGPTLIRGVLSGSAPPYDALLHTVLNRLEEGERWLTLGERTLWKAEQGHLDAHDEWWLEYEQESRFKQIPELLWVIIEERQQRVGDALVWLRQFSHPDQLLESYCDTVDSWKALSHEHLVDLLALAGRCAPEKQALAWHAIGKAKCVALGDVLLRALPEHHPRDLAECWTALAALYQPQQLTAAVQARTTGLSFVHRATVAAGAWDAHDVMADQQYCNAVYSILSGDEATVIAACQAVNAGASPFPDLTEPEWQLVEVLADHPEETLALAAVRLLVDEERDASPWLSRLQCSQSYEVRLKVLPLIDANAASDSRAQILTALRDKDYRCRSAAMKLLAPGDSPSEEATLLALAADPSAHVREEFAMMVGDEQWQAALPALSRLLYDRHDQPVFGTPLCYHVAREAAAALASFEELPEPIISELIAFVREGRVASDDDTVHYSLVNLLSESSSPAALQLLQDCLLPEFSASKDVKHEAAWALAWKKLRRLPESREQISLPLLARTARSAESPVAELTLMALGLTGQRAVSHLQALIADGTLTPDTALLVESASLLGDQPLPTKFFAAVLPHTHPGYQTLTWVREHMAHAPTWSGLYQQVEPAWGWCADLTRSGSTGEYTRRCLDELLVGNAGEPDT